MINRAEAISLPVSVQPLKNDALKSKGLGALLLTAAFALLSSAAWATNDIAVHVQNINGGPIAGAGVCACHFGPNGPDSQSVLATSDANGDVTFLGITGNLRYEILIATQGYVPTIHAQYANPNHTFVFADDSGSTLNATVSLSSNNVSGVGVIAAVVTGATPSSVILGGLKLGNGVSAGDGFGFADLSGNTTVYILNVFYRSSNTYVLNVFDPAPAANKTIPIGVDKTLSVDQSYLSYSADFAQGVTNNNIQQQQPSGAGNLSVTGVIVDSNSAPVPYTSIQFCQVNNNSGYNCNSQYYSNSDGNGRFSVTGLSTGPYSVYINQSCNPNGLVCYGQYSNGSVGSPEFTYTGALKNLTFTLQKMLPGTGVLNVVITDSFGNPMPQSWVSLWPDGDQGHNYSQALSGDPYYNTPGLNNVNVNAPNGVAHITGLYPGNYFLQVSNNFVATADGSGVKFNYTAGAVTDQDGKFQNGDYGATSYRLTINPGLGTDDVQVFDNSSPANPLTCNAPSAAPNGFVDPYSSHALCSFSGPPPATSTITVAMPTAGSGGNDAVVRINYSFPAAEDLRLQPIMITLQPQCDSNCQPGGGFAVLGGAAQLGGTWPQTGHVDIPVQSGVTYNININADKWGWNRGEGDESRVDASGSLTNLNMPFVPAGRITGNLYTPTNTLFVPFQTNNGQLWANVNAEGQGPGYGNTQVNNDGSYSIGGLIPGKYTMNADVNVPSGLDFNYASPFNLPVVNVTANQDTYLDLHTVNAVAVQPQIDLSSTPPVTQRFCSGDSYDCRPENYIVKIVPQGTSLTSNATLRDFMDLTNGNSDVTSFGFTSTTTENQGHGCHSNNPIPNTFCPNNIPAPGVYDFYALRADDFAQGVSTGPKPSFVILGSTKAFAVSPERATSGVPDTNNGQIVSSLNPLQCRQPIGGNNYGPEGTCTMKKVQALPIISESTTRTQATIQGAIIANTANVFRQQDFDSWGGDFGNFMKYIPLVTLYDSSGTLKAAGSILPNPGCLTDALGNALNASVSQGNYALFQTTIKGWITCSAGKGIPLGFEIRGLPPQTKYNLVLTSPNYPPYQTTVTTGLDKTTTTVAAINLDGLGTGETLVVNVVDTTTMLGIAAAPMVLSGPAYDARTFTANSTGTIAIAGLAASAYNLSVQVPGYALASLNVPLVGTGKLTLNIGLTPASSQISGSVYGLTTGGSVLQPGADVYAYDNTLNAQHAGDPKFSLPLYHTVTSTAGYYSFTGLLSGDEFKVTAKVTGFYVSGATVATSGSPVTQDFSLKPKPLDIDVYGKPAGFVYQFTIKNPSDFADGQAWIQFQDPNTSLPAFAPFYSTNTSNQFSVNFAKVSDNQLQLNYPVGSGFNYNLHIEAQSYGGDTVVKNIPFSHDSLNTVQQIDQALVGDNTDSGTGATNNQVLIDPTGSNPSALTIPPGSMIPVDDNIAPTAQFNAVNPLDAPEGGVFQSTAAFAGNVYDLTLSSVNFTGTGFDLTISYDPANTNLNDLDMYVFINDSNGVSASALRPQSMYKTKAIGQWWSLKALGFPLTVNAQNHTITVKGLKTLSSVLSVKDSPMAAINTGRGFRPSTAYKTLGISPNEKSAFAVMKPSKQVKKPTASPAAHPPVVLGISSITWTWGAVAGAIDYRFYPSTGGNPITVAGTAITLDGLNANTAYGGKVSAMNNSGEGPLKLLTTAYTLAAPVSNTTVDPAKVFVSTAHVSWDDTLNPVGKTTKYKVEWYKAATPATIVSKISTITYTTLTALVPGTTYFVRVRAINFANKISDADTAQSFWTLPLKIAAAPVLTVSPIATTVAETMTVDQATWNWKAVPNAQRYEVFEVALGTFDLTNPTVTTEDLFYTKTGLTANTAYGIRVRAINDFTGPGPLTVISSVTSLNATPSNVVATAAHASLIVTWGRNGAAANTAYQVQYKKTSVATWTTVVATASVNSPSKTFPAITGQAYDVRVRSLNAKLVPGVPEYAAGTATPTIAKVTAAAPEWKWEIPSGDVAKPGVVTSGTSAALAKVLAFPNPLLAGQPGINFVYVPANASIKITNPAGTTVRTFTVTGGAVTWNGTDATGHKVPNGLYTATLESAGAQRVITLAVQR